MKVKPDVRKVSIAEHLLITTTTTIITSIQLCDPRSQTPRCRPNERFISKSKLSREQPLPGKNKPRLLKHDLNITTSDNDTIPVLQRPDLDPHFQRDLGHLGDDDDEPSGNDNRAPLNHV